MKTFARTCQALQPATSESTSSANRRGFFGSAFALAAIPSALMPSGVQGEACPVAPDSPISLAFEFDGWLQELTVFPPLVWTAIDPGDRPSNAAEMDISGWFVAIRRIQPDAKTIQTWERFEREGLIKIDRERWDFRMATWEERHPEFAGCRFARRRAERLEDRAGGAIGEIAIARKAELIAERAAADRRN